jgi:Flp pilus assembly pilin Flp
LRKQTASSSISASPQLKCAGKNNEKTDVAFGGKEAGQDLTEYALLTVLIALAAITAMNELATAISTAYSNAAAKLATT